MDCDQAIPATAVYDHSVRFRQVHGGVCLQTIPYPDSKVNAMKVTPNRQLLAVVGYQRVKMFDIPSFNPNPERT